MSDVITHGADVIAPTLITGYESARESSNLVHPILGRAGDDVTLRPAKLRTGRLELLFTDDTSEEDSAEAEAILAAAGVCILTSSSRGSIEMPFIIPQGAEIARELEDRTRRHWLVRVGFQEVAP